MVRIERLILIAALVGADPIAFGQGPPVVLQPLVADSASLFFAPNVEWKCAPRIGGLRPLQDMDFANVERCECHQVGYEQALDAWNRYYQRQKTLELRARLTRTSETTFTYSEVDRVDSTRITKVVPMVFDPTKVVRTDTLYATPMLALPDTLVVFRITKFIELKAK